MIVINPVVETGLVNFRVPSEPVEPAVRHRDRHALRAAAHRRRSGPAHGHRQADRRNGGAGRAVLARALHAAATTGSRTCAAFRGARFTRSRASASTRSTRSPSAMPRPRTSSSAGRWASRIMRTASQNVQAIANLALMRGMVGRPQRGPAADSRPLERARHRQHGRHAEAQGRGLRRARARVRRQAADDAGPRHARLHRGGPCRAAEDRLLPGRQSVWLESRRHVRRRGARQARHARLSQHDAQHGPRPRPGPRDDHPAGARPRRRAAADDAGIDVQLRAPERRRPAAARGAAERSARSSPRSPTRMLGAAARSIGQSMAQHRQHPRGDRQGRSRLRSSWPRSTDTKQEFQIAGRTFHEPQFPTPTAGPDLARARAAGAGRRRWTSCG